MYYLLENNFENINIITKFLGEPYLNNLYQMSFDYIIIINFKNKKWSTINKSNIITGKYKIVEINEFIKIIRKEKLDQIYE